MKTEHENERIERMCNHLGWMLSASGLVSDVTYDEEKEFINVTGAINASVCVYASSTQACIIDIFRQLLPVVEGVVR